MDIRYKFKQRRTTMISWDIGVNLFPHMPYQSCTNFPLICFSSSKKISTIRRNHREAHFASYKFSNLVLISNQVAQFSAFPTSWIRHLVFMLKGWSDGGEKIERHGKCSSDWSGYIKDNNAAPHIRKLRVRKQKNN